MRLVVLALTVALGCREANTGPSRSSRGHVFVLVEENTNYASVIGSGAMPYLNSLAQRYGLATEYYANTHPSIGNYFMLTAGDTVTNNDDFVGTVTRDNIIRQLQAAGLTWKSYAENIPEVGFLGSAEAKLYVRRHNPLSYFGEVVDDSTQRKNLVPFSQLGLDLATGSLPNYGFIVPNNCHNAHNCPLDSADTWLRSNIAPLITTAAFQADGLLIIVFDEAATDDSRGGGRVVWIAIGPRIRPAFRSDIVYQHESTLRLTMEALGLTRFPGAASTAKSMRQFLTP